MADAAQDPTAAATAGGKASAAEASGSQEAQKSSSVPGAQGLAALILASNAAANAGGSALPSGGQSSASGQAGADPLTSAETAPDGAVLDLVNGAGKPSKTTSPTSSEKASADSDKKDAAKTEQSSDPTQQAEATPSLADPTSALAAPLPTAVPVTIAASSEGGSGGQTATTATPPALASIAAATSQSAAPDDGSANLAQGVQQTSDPQLAGAAVSGKPAAAAVDGKKPEGAPPRQLAADIPSGGADAVQGDPTLGADPTSAGAATSASASAQSHASSGATSSAASSPTATASGPQQALTPFSGIPVLIAGKAAAASNHFEIRLDPPELGRIEVRLKVDRDGQISSHLIADRADTLALLRRDGAGLERALQDAGLKTTGDGLQFSLRDQSGGQPDGRRPSLVTDDNAPVELDLAPRSYARFAGRTGGLDIRV